MSQIPARQITPSVGQYVRKYPSLVGSAEPRTRPYGERQYDDSLRLPDNPSEVRAAVRSISRDRLSVIPAPLAEGLAIRATGELDLSNAAELARELEAATQSHRFVLLDLSEISFMDGFALRVIVQADRYLRRSGGRLVLCVSSLQVRRLLAVTGEDRVLASMIPAKSNRSCWPQRPRGDGRRERADR